MHVPLDHKLREFIAKIKTLIPPTILQAACQRLNAETDYHKNGRKNSNKVTKRASSSESNSKTTRSSDSTASSSLPTYTYTHNSFATILAAAHDLLILFSGKRLGLNMVLDMNAGRSQAGFQIQNPGLVDGADAGLMSAMEQELMRIASEREKEVKRLEDVNRNLRARMQRLME